jgi:G3E family GTPase
MPRARYIMIGGFLGAGKTTTLRAIGQLLTDAGQRVGLITNDQARGLVDTALTKAQGLPTEEISGGCFCCRFNSLLDAAKNLTQETRPDVLLAEPVGSCTDLVATVSLPLQQIYGDQFDVAAYAVLLDPIRAERLLELQPGRQFTANVQYIYRKQLEEAQHLIINKTDLLTLERLAALEEALQVNYPNARVWKIEARTGRGVAELVDALMTSQLAVSSADIMPLDYATYGDGEAQLGWLNASVALSNADEWEGNAWLASVARELQQALQAEGVEIAHLKMLLSLAEDPYELAAVNLVRSDGTAELSHRLADLLEDGHLLINCRAEADPELLQRVVRRVVSAVAASAGLAHRWDSLDYFRPGMPTPTHLPAR